MNTLLSFCSRYVIRLICYTDCTVVFVVFGAKYLILLFSVCSHFSSKYDFFFFHYIFSWNCVISFIFSDLIVCIFLITFTLFPTSLILVILKFSYIINCHLIKEVRRWKYAYWILVPWHSWENGKQCASISCWLPFAHLSVCLIKACLISG